MTVPCIRTGEDRWEERLADAVSAVGARRRTRVVAFEGHSGSGKSTVAERLRTVLEERGEPAAVVAMEDLYPGWHGLGEAPGLLLEWVLVPLARGGRAAWRRYDWSLGRFLDGWTELDARVAAGGTLIVEGCGSGAASVRPFLDLLVWVRAPRRVRADRLDVRADADAYAPHRRTWADQERAFHTRDRPRDHAGLVVDNSRPSPAPVSRR